MLLGGHMCMFCGVLSTVGEHNVTGVQYMPIIEVILKYQF